MFENMDILIITALIGSIGFLINMFIIDPILTQKKEITRISSSLDYYAWAIAYPNYPDIDRDKIVAFEERSVASNILRKHGSDLKSFTESIPLYNSWPICKFTIEYQNVLKACEKLTGLSNSVITGISSENKEDVAELRKLLRI